MRKEYRRVMRPKQGSFVKSEESQIGLGNRAGLGFSMLGKDRGMCLEDICLDILRKTWNPKRISTHIKYAVYDYLANRAMWTGRNRLNWLGLPEDGAQEDDADQTEH